MDRRDILKSGLSTACAALLLPLALPVQVALASGGQPTPGNTIRALTHALRVIGGNVCFDAAERLDAIAEDVVRFNLHLRRAGLSVSDADLLAAALRSPGTETEAALTSFSVSYNPGIGDAGADAIASALPASLSELGMVGCDLGDQAGAALYRWAREAPNLQTICIEQNRFSENVKARFADLARQRPEILIVV